MRRTVIVNTGMAANAIRLQSARAGAIGVQVMTPQQVACRLAGGFTTAIDPDTLAGAVAAAIRATPQAELGDLVTIADLPGLPATLASTLTKVWHADLDLQCLAAEQPGIKRLAVLARLETAVLTLLPAAMLPASALVDAALSRIDHAPAVLGALDCRSLLHLAPCWQRLLDALGTGSGWWRTRPAAAGTPRTVSCATARHEVIEAMRWARALLATGNVQAHEIAFAAASPGEYDDLVLALSAEANLDVHFANGHRALATHEGQATAALADILLNGLSQDRVRRLARLAHDKGTPFGSLPKDWMRTLPRAAPLSKPERWRQAVTSLEAAAQATLAKAIALLSAGPAKAAEAGELFLRGTPRLLWRRALLRAPASSLATTLAALRLPDSVEVATSIAWMPAATLAGAPRAHVWLLGLNARTWPRAAAEDPLLPDHLLASVHLDPVSVTQRDREVFQAIVAVGTAVCSASRRDATGRMLGLSPLLPHTIAPERLRRARIPDHAMSEQDRLMARPSEFALSARAMSARGCWQDWNRPEITPHDGMVRADHPVLQRALDRIQSASSLRQLLRNPLGFTWHYALGWREPDDATETMDLDPLQFGSLVHDLLETALPAIEVAGGIGGAGRAAIAQAIEDARVKVATIWEASRPVPPALLWARSLAEAAAMAIRALLVPLLALPDQRSFAEVPFGDPDAGAGTGSAPWDTTRLVTIPGTDIQIRGRIDRLDLDAEGRTARVVDYKTGKPHDPGTLKGGAELQRCLYAYAVAALLSHEVEVEALLLFPASEPPEHYRLEDTGSALTTLTGALVLARDSLFAGRALPGPNTGARYDDMMFALPAGPEPMLARKREAAAAMLGAVTQIWDAP